VLRVSAGGGIASFDLIPKSGFGRFVECVFLLYPSVRAAAFFFLDLICDREDPLIDLRQLPAPRALFIPFFRFHRHLPLFFRDGLTLTDGLGSPSKDPGFFLVVGFFVTRHFFKPPLRSFLSFRGFFYLFRVLEEARS